MKLDSRQTRRLHLAGTIAYPAPFPSVGVISLERGSLRYSARSGAKRQRAPLVVVQETPYESQAVTRVILRKDVAAIFFPGYVKKKAKEFRFSRRAQVTDFEKGQWFVGPEIKISTIVEKLGVPRKAITRRRSVARGLVFIREGSPVLTLSETTESAGEHAAARARVRPGCECKRGCEC
jgi:hypothetical protein